MRPATIKLIIVRKRPISTRSQLSIRFVVRISVFKKKRNINKRNHLRVRVRQFRPRRYNINELEFIFLRVHRTGSQYFKVPPNNKSSKMCNLHIFQEWLYLPWKDQNMHYLDWALCKQRTLFWEAATSDEQRNSAIYSPGRHGRRFKIIEVAHSTGIEVCRLDQRCVAGENLFAMELHRRVR